MPAGNYDNEIKDAMQPNSKAMPKKNAGAGKPSPNLHMKQSSNATAKAPPAPHHFAPPQQQPPGLQQQTDQFAAHMAPSGPSLPQSSGLQQAHASIVSALANRDMLKGH